MSFLIDTNIISELRKKKGNPMVREWFSALAEDDIFLSVLTIGEIRRGIQRVHARDSRQASTLNSWLSVLTDAYAERLLPIDRHVAEEWGRLPWRDALPVIDALIGATARVHGLTVATRNVRDISRAGAVCINPFEPQ